MRGDTATIAVLGGGVGGLTAAHELAERGLSVTVYEAADRLGGKAKSHAYRPTPDVALPAEHGFRYVPGFYRHLRDTLARIPREDGTTVADHLLGTEETLVASVTDSESLKRTQTPTTVDEWMAAIRPSVGDDQLDLREINYFQRRLLTFLTSGRLRRRDELDQVTLWEFLDADNQSRAYRTYLAEVTQALVAMDPRRASARSICRIHVQLVLDQVHPERSTEAIFDGPTSDVWIEPWVEHLRSHGVQFRTGAPVTAIETDGKRVTGAVIDGTSEPVTADYYVAAVPVEVMAELVSPELVRAAPTLAGIGRLETAWMNGLQFYLTEDVPLSYGHQAYVDAPWGLTSISQSQFWADGPFALADYSDDVEGVLSVNVADWETPGVLYGKPAIECTPEEIKTEVWTQMAEHLNREEERLTEDLIYDWALDPAITYDSDEDRLTNRAPLLINTVGSFRHRPPADTHAPNLVLAADYVRTETDLATMESANEAGRRAARAILDDVGAHDLPRVWSLAEPRVFEPIKRFDDAAFRMGLPHPGELEREVRGGLVGQVDHIAGRLLR